MTWHAKPRGAFSIDSQEAYDNAVESWGILKSKGWTLEAFSGYWGNVGGEGGYNPWRWQSDNIPASTDSPWTNRGYGFTQFTPGGKYINAAAAQQEPGYGPNFSDVAGNILDGQAQVNFLDGYADYYQTASYPLNYDEYKISLETPEYLASAWLYNYERPADPASVESQRRVWARYWFDKLSGVIPPIPTKLPIWLYFKIAKGGK